MTWAAGAPRCLWKTRHGPPGAASVALRFAFKLGCDGISFKWHAAANPINILQACLGKLAMMTTRRSRKGRAGCNLAVSLVQL